jgi:hypothetical protein
VVYCYKDIIFKLSIFNFFNNGWVSTQNTIYDIWDVFYNNNWIELYISIIVGVRYKQKIIIQSNQIAYEGSKMAMPLLGTDTNIFYPI